jgi:hypothetical protein
VDLSPGDEEVSIALDSLGTAGAVLDSSNSPAHVRIDGRGRNIQLGGTPTGNAVITVKSGVTLYLRNITLTGMDANTAPLITVEAGGTLALEDAAAVRGNTNTTALDANTSNAANNAGGIGVYGTLRMEGGEISGNTAIYGGGVYVKSGTLRMEGGEISGNTANRAIGGVRISFNGTFTMEGGEISGNTAGTSTGYGYGYGGGVESSGNFTMGGGKISRNTATFVGGGVVSESDGTFIMTGGEISANTVTGTANDAGGGGVFNRGVFTMMGGEISGNTACKNGGGVYNSIFSNVPAEFTMMGGKISGNTAINGGGVYSTRAWQSIGTGIFTMQGGEISGNTASAYGGGVFVYCYGSQSGSDYGTFIKTGGTIYGDTDTDHTPGSTENTAASGGHAVYVSKNGKKRDHDAGTEDDLYARYSYSSGSWTFTDGTILDIWE